MKTQRNDRRKTKTAPTKPSRSSSSDRDFADEVEQIEQDLVANVDRFVAHMVERSGQWSPEEGRAFVLAIRLELDGPKTPRARA